MKHVTPLLFFIAGCAGQADPPVPLPSGDYAFAQRFAEHPGIKGVPVRVRISGLHVVVANPVASGPFPAGVLDEGTLLWHAGTRQWIIGQDPADRLVRDVGGCSGGPGVIDLEKRIYWTC